MKALGTGWAKGVSFGDIALLPDAQGVPRLVLEGEARQVADRLGAVRWHCSVSHSDGFAIAMVILEGSGAPAAAGLGRSGDATSMGRP
jgi:holo-[acyl-carrier protein] synthase